MVEFHRTVIAYDFSKTFVAEENKCNDKTTEDVINFKIIETMN